MLSIEERISLSQEALLFMSWALFLVRLLCEVPDGRALGKAEELAARVRANTSGVHTRSSIVSAHLARVAFLRGHLEEAVELFRAGLATLSNAPASRSFCFAPYIHTLLGLGHASEARLVAEQALGALTAMGGAGCFEVEARLAVTEAFEESGDHERARAELAETLRQIQLRLDDIADPFWKNSYLTRNRYVAQALALGREWGVSALTGTGA
jgi:hypothetical protein